MKPWMWSVTLTAAPLFTSLSTVHCISDKHKSKSFNTNSTNEWKQLITLEASAACKEDKNNYLTEQKINKVTIGNWLAIKCRARRTLSTGINLILR